MKRNETRNATETMNETLNETVTETTTQVQEMCRKSVAETIELGIKIQDEMLSNMDRQLAAMQDGVRFSMENQKHVLELTKSNLVAGRDMWRQGLVNWQKLVESAVARS